MRLSPVAPEDPWLLGRRPFPRLLAEAAAEIGAHLRYDKVFGHVGDIERPGKTRLMVFGNALSVNADAAAALAADKDYTARRLAAEGLPSPAGLLVFGPAYRAHLALKTAALAEHLPGPDAALPWAQAMGWPLIVKPNQGSEGRGIRLVSNAVELSRAIEGLFETDQKVRIERAYPGADHRVVVWQGRVALAYRRRPAQVTGDGQSTLGALVDALRDGLARQDRGPKLPRPAIAAHLRGAGLGLDTVLPKGRVQSLLPNANLSMGGQCEDLTGALTPGLEAMACRAAEHLGLRLAGVDILATDDTDAAGATILEVNSAPGVDGYAASGPDRWNRARALLCDVLRGA